MSSADLDFAGLIVDWKEALLKSSYRSTLGKAEFIDLMLLGK